MRLRAAWRARTCAPITPGTPIPAAVCRPRPSPCPERPHCGQPRILPTDHTFILFRAAMAAIIFPLRWKSTMRLSIAIYGEKANEPRSLDYPGRRGGRGQDDGFAQHTRRAGEAWLKRGCNPRAGRDGRCRKDAGAVA